MLALLYLAFAFYLGDQVSRRFFRYLSIAHRCAAAIVVGLLISSWFTYATAWLFQHLARPVLWGDLCFFAVALATIWWLRRRSPRFAQYIEPRVPGGLLWD